MLKVHHKIVCN